MKTAIFLADGFETVEALAVVDILRRAGIENQMVSISENEMVVTSHSIGVKADIRLSEVDFNALDMMILPGGMPGTKNLEACEELMQALDAFYAAGKKIAAICAAPSILAHRGMLKGKRACSYPNFEEHLTAGGATVTKDAATVDGNMITARGMGCAVEFGLTIVAQLVGSEKAEEIRRSIVAC